MKTEKIDWQQIYIESKHRTWESFKEWLSKQNLSSQEGKQIPTDRIRELINNYWRFDEYKHPASSWHDKQDLLNAIEEISPSKEEKETAIAFAEWIERNNYHRCAGVKINFGKWTNDYKIYMTTHQLFDLFTK